MTSALQVFVLVCVLVALAPPCASLHTFPAQRLVQYTHNGEAFGSQKSSFVAEGSLEGAKGKVTILLAEHLTSAEEIVKVNFFPRTLFNSEKNNTQLFHLLVPRYFFF